MGTLMIVYETRYGQTRRIAGRVAEVARRCGHDARIVEVAAVDPRELGSADAFVVLAPVYMKRHPPATRNFAMLHGDALNERPSAFVSVSGSAASQREADREEARHVAHAFLAETPWRPNLIRTTGGAIAYPRYGWFVRRFMKMIARREGAPLDTTQTHELTDWNDVERLARELVSFLDAEEVPTLHRTGASPALTS